MLSAKWRPFGLGLNVFRSEQNGQAIVDTIYKGILLKKQFHISTKMRLLYM